jgi:hypothetical protein
VIELVESNDMHRLSGLVEEDFGSKEEKFTSGTNNIEGGVANASINVDDIKAEAHAKRVSQVMNSSLNTRRVSSLKEHIVGDSTSALNALAGIREDTEEVEGCLASSSDFGSSRISRISRNRSESLSVKVSTHLQDVGARRKKEAYEQDARERAVLLLRDLHTHAPINLNLVTKAGHQVLWWYRFRRHKAWYAARMLAIVLPILLVAVEPPRDPSYDVFYQRVVQRDRVGGVDTWYVRRHARGACVLT